jgi:hypothetical protein
MINVTLPIYSAKRAIGLILNSNNLKNAVKILYPNRLIVNEVDVKAIERVLAPAFIKGVYTTMVSNSKK